MPAIGAEVVVLGLVAPDEHPGSFAAPLIVLESFEQVLGPPIGVGNLVDAGFGEGGDLASLGRELIDHREGFAEAGNGPPVPGLIEIEAKDIDVIVAGVAMEVLVFSSDVLWRVGVEKMVDLPGLAEVVDGHFPQGDEFLIAACLDSPPRPRMVVFVKRAEDERDGRAV